MTNSSNELTPEEAARVARENAVLDSDYRVSEQYRCCDDPNCEGNQDD